jgi:UDP-N-acetylmuramate dehydrogenase
MNKYVLSKNDINQLGKIIPGGIEENVDLSKISHWKIGGIADIVVRPSSTEEVSSVIKYLSKHNLPYVVIGSTSNLLFSDDGLRAVCIQIGNHMDDYKVKDNKVWAQAGVWVPGFARNVAKAGLSGIEHIAGIPGTVGGLVCMNGGSQRKGIGSNIIKVTAVSFNGDVEVFDQSDCKFEYRTSVFQQNGYIITEVEFTFEETKSYGIIRNEMLDILKSRRNKFPQKLPNCGSTFISNPDIYKKYGPPGKVIEDLGYKGYRIGGAEVSMIHANFINNTGNASAKDVIKIVKIIKNDVKKHTGFDMVSEVKLVDEKGIIKPVHLA